MSEKENNSKIDRSLLVLKEDLKEKIVEINKIKLYKDKERIKKDYLRGIYDIDDDLEA